MNKQTIITILLAIVLPMTQKSPRLNNQRLAIFDGVKILLLLFLISFSKLNNAGSLRATCKLYFVCRYISESAGTSSAASNMSAVFAVSGR